MKTIPCARLERNFRSQAVGAGDLYRLEVQRFLSGGRTGDPPLSRPIPSTTSISPLFSRSSWRKIEKAACLTGKNEWELISLVEESVNWLRVSSSPLYAISLLSELDEFSLYFELIKDSLSWERLSRFPLHWLRGFLGHKVVSNLPWHQEGSSSGKYHRQFCPQFLLWRMTVQYRTNVRFYSNVSYFENRCSYF